VKHYGSGLLQRGALMMETAAKYVDRENEAYKKLTGAKKHFCPDWDFMAIDETTPEFEACCCKEYNKPDTK